MPVANLYAKYSEQNVSHNSPLLQLKRVVVKEEISLATHLTMDNAAIMKDLIPAKAYDQAWAAFIAFNKNGGFEEEDFLRYFHHLKHQKNYKASSLWAIHSSPTKKLQQETGCCFKEWGCLSALLKNYNQGYTRKVCK